MTDTETLKEYAIDLSRRNIITPYVAEKLISKHRKECKTDVKNFNIGSPEEQYTRWLKEKKSCAECDNMSRCNGNNIMCFAIWANTIVCTNKERT